MSRKTKEEKKLAEYRRRLKHLQQAVQTENLNQPKNAGLQLRRWVPDEIRL